MSLELPSMISLAIEPPEAIRQASWAEDDIIFREQGDIQVDGYTIPMHISHEHLRVEGTIGRGACSYVQRMKHKRTGKLFAVKIFDLYNREIRGQLVREIKVLSHVECPSLITFHGAFHRDAKIGIVLEYMDRGSLNDIIEEHFQVPEATLAAMTYQILIGLAYLHFDGRLHRDVKPSNILLNSRGEIKLSDFGIARELEAEGGFAETMVGTVKYMSPERLDGDLYGPPSDIWSLGIVLLELWHRRHVFDQEENHIDLMEIFHAQSIEQVLPVQDLPPLMKEFVLACVALDPKDRVIAEVLLYSPWIQQFDIVEPHSYVTAVNIVRLWMDSLSDEWTQGRVKLEGDHLRSTFPSSSGSEDGDESATELCGSVSDIGLFSPRSTPATPLSPWSPAPVASTSWGDTDSSRPSVGVPTADCSSSAVPSHVHQAHEPIVGTE